jgi:hypothetical protein
MNTVRNSEITVTVRHLEFAETASTDTARNSAVINTVRNTAFKYNVSNPEITDRNSRAGTVKNFLECFFPALRGALFLLRLLKTVDVSPRNVAFS